MISAPIPDNESKRLDALYKYHILDTEAEKVFDDLTQLASDICDTPIALISLIDPDRQWFKSKVGLDADQTTRDIAFCAHAIHQKQIFEVRDTHNDIRFKDNPLVTEAPNIRFYAGMPLLTPEGLAIGTLCAISDQPHALNEHQRNALEILGREVITQLELRLKIRQLELANERKADFLSSLSHELRTPLNAIISLSQLMFNDKQHPPAAKHLTYLQHLDFSGKRLLDLVNSILDLSKIESGKIELNPSHVSITSFFDSIEGLITSIAQSAQVTLDFQVSAKEYTHIFIDEARLSQILLNLASNAVKFSSPKQTVNINVVLSEDLLTFAVKDSGVGIAEQEQSRLFGKFEQLHTDKKLEGTGLGLMITKSLVELMGGSIKLNSALGMGTLVKVSIPVKNSKKAIRRTISKTSIRDFDPDAAILVVEDNEINQQVAIAIFQSFGLDIDIAGSGEEAVQQVQQRDYDLVFMDLHLPGIDGKEASKQISAKIPHLPIVALTADVYVQPNKEIVDSGICSVLHKPIVMGQLIAALNEYCPNSNKK
ncbi:GAF domain-containing hybrid sensor histidine kinase/response regulator [Aliiglaciecola litoralis]|uniref:histidine kinase n=1 Tax=Aliiglaciecola litoralis TaxID=582857 RepID=A0ABN1LQL3_9ALTE